ncbi:hypothetical protein [Vacuolonema iberomarrocanum]|uniref:hypothetical protein n=1 Tax=Vacuolonema iberomarrocanum TaxID=3454632 RepID=UPI0019F8662C|nr:hypothetical protein [filamentous cyanobacterium LEGE 07170]
MEFWEFLIQREGDRSWLPLESPDVEVLEGRYRMVARSSRSRVPVEVAIAHTLLDEHPPRRRFKKRQGFTNPDGVMVVFPYTWLQPGLWEFQCSGEQITSAGRDTWQQAVQLHVIAQESEVADDWVPELPGDRSAFSFTSVEPSQSAAFQPDGGAQNNPGRDEDCRSGANPSVADRDKDAVASTHPSAADLPVAGEPDLNPFGSFAQPHPHLEETAATALSDTSAPAPVASANLNPATSKPSDDDLTDPLEPEAPSLLSAEAALRQQAEADSDAVMASLMAGLELDDLDDAETPAAEDNDAAAVESEEEIVPSMPTLDPNSVRLVLNETNLVVQPNTPITLNGAVEAVGEPTTPYLPPVALQITLRDPQTASVVLETRRSLTSRLLPCSFSCQVALPNNSHTRMLIGKLALITLATPDDDPVILVSEDFSVTASLDELLQAIASNVSADLKAAFGDEAPPAALDLSLLNVVQPLNDRPATMPKSVPMPKPSEPQILPPKLNVEATPRPKPSAPSPIDLPQMQSAVERAEAKMEPQPTAPDPFVPTESDPLEEADDVLKGLESVDFESIEQSEPIETDANEQPEPAASAEELAFRSLDLQNRFFERLNSLATDAELSNFLGDRPLSGTNNPAAAREVVIEDDAPIPPRRSLSFQTSPRVTQPDPDTALNTEPPPTPQIFIKTGELVSGETVDVTVTMPQTPHPIGVKLWLQDLQNRALLDGPRWLMNFVPNSNGDREAWASLTVPHGCLEVQLEAIAIELATQRESHKVTCDRPVIPPDLPSLSLDELEI